MRRSSATSRRRSEGAGARLIMAARRSRPRPRGFGFAFPATPVGPVGDWATLRRASIALVLVACALAAAIAGRGVVSPPDAGIDTTTAGELSWPLSGGLFAGSGLAPQPAASDADRRRVAEDYGKLPLAFEQNRGQTDGRVDFLARAPGHTAFLTPTGATLALQPAGEDAKGAALRLELTGADPAARPVGQERLPGVVNVLRGDDPAKWVTGAPTFARVRYHDVYPGIDLAWYGTHEGRLEYDFIVRPGADPSAIGLELEGARRVSLADSGALRIETAAGTLVQRPPVAYQQIAGERRRVESRYELSGRSVHISVGDYDRDRPLVIDPALVYSTFLGGGGFDLGFGIAVDGTGSAYVAGFTGSADFPTTPGAFDTTYNGADLDAFVTKLDPAGSSLLYSTFLGGESNDLGTGIALDGGGSAYVVGATASSNFPTTPGAFDTSHNGNEDAFVTKLDATGSALAYSTYLGGRSPQGSAREDVGIGIAIDASGSAYVAGRTESATFPTTPGAFDTSYNGGADAFVTKLDPAGSSLLYSTFLGGGGFDNGIGIALDGGGSAYVVGSTDSADFPTTPAAFDTTFNGGFTDAFVTKLDPAGSSLLYSTFLGGAVRDAGDGIALDGGGSAYVVGSTDSSNFPTTPGAFDTTFNGGDDAFVTKLDPPGSTLLYSTFLGGPSTDSGTAIDIDRAGRAYVTGHTSSSSFPTTAGAFDTTYNGGGDAFVTTLDPAGSSLLYSTFLGGASSDVGHGIAIDGRGFAYVAGFTGSTNFPTTPGAFDTTFNGVFDAYAAKLDVGVGPGPPATLTLEPKADTNEVGTRHCVTATVRDASGNPVPDVTVRFTVTGSVNTSGSNTTDSDGRAQFCYTGPDFPGADTIRAFADTDEDNSQDPGEPSDTATKAWVLPPSTPGCEVIITEGGRITANNGDRATFGGNAKLSEDGVPTGQEEYTDHGPAQPLKVKSTRILAVTCSEDRREATIFGEATVDGSGSHLFRIRVTDNGEPGTNDIYGILLSTGYASGDKQLEGGNVQIR
jgi:hypothetical protein